MSQIQTMKGDGPPSDMQGRHGDLTSAYKSAHARHSMPVDNTQQNAAGVGLGDSDSDPNNLTTSTYNGSDMPDDTSGYGKGVGPVTPMVSSSSGGDDSSDSNMTAGGRPVG